MLHASTQQLIRKLCELTDAGSINWKEGKGQVSLLETEGYVVEIQPEPPSVRLLRNDGQELESADASDLAAPWGSGEGTFADHVADMARRANRYARGAETAIAKILSSLSAPPKKQIEPEAEPAALAFAAATEKPTHSVQASESAAAIAAVNADLESQRRKAKEDPPVSHSVAEAPAPLISPETETAIDRVLAVHPPVIVEKPKEEVELPKPVAAAPPVEAPKPAPIVAPRPAPVLPIVVEAAPAQFAPAPAPVQAKPAQPAPVPTAAAQQTPAPVATMAKAGFGAIDGFARAQPAGSAPQAVPQTAAPPERKPQPEAPASSGLIMRRFSAQSRQTVEPSTTKDFYRAAPTNAAPTAAAPEVAPAVAKSEPKPEPAKPAGRDVYKPWG
ncbi:MAG: hypothetical protein EON61_04300 [Alphaproteobacteria bacterium]|nr:MAG: hypothetical protein EON61_04300 [Alphaproteobacteria bacterium]